MYANYFKRCLAGLIICLTIFGLCFALRNEVSATESIPEESLPVSSETDSSLTTSSEETSSEETSSNEDSSVDGSSDSSDESALESDVSNDEPSNDESEVSSEFSDVSSEDVISQVSEGGAPDFYDGHYYNDGSYEYHGSYAGLSSSVSSQDENNKPDKTPSNRSALAQKYAKYFSVGMIVFGCLAVLMIVLLIYFNLKVKQSKLTYPDWYRRREARQKGKHAKH